MCGVSSEKNTLLEEFDFLKSVTKSLEIEKGAIIEALEIKLFSATK